MLRSSLAALVTLLLCATAGLAQWTSSRPDGHAPIGVMQDHRHEEGEVMLAYRFMYMEMEGSRDGTDAIGDQRVISDPPAGFGFQVTPTRMPMQMHMFGLMYAPSDRITLMGMLPLVFKDMDHITRAGGTREDPAFTTRSGGVGDLKAIALVGLANWGRQAVHLNLGVSVPIGSADEMDALPNSLGEVQLPYPMQIGSGTWEALPGVTYLGQLDDLSWGAQTLGTIRFDENDRGWRLGNRIMGTAWGAWRFNSNLSASLRWELSAWGDVEGMDPAASVNPAVVPTARTDLRSGTRVDVGPGVNLYIPAVDGLRFAGELLLPVYQDLDGPQLETDWTLVVGAQIVPVSTH